MTVVCGSFDEILSMHERLRRAGEENLDFVESLRESSIKLMVTRHEQTAGFMAATMGRLTGKAGVALATLGPGATNFTTAAAYAHLGADHQGYITPSRAHVRLLTRVGVWYAVSAGLPRRLVIAL